MRIATTFGTAVVASLLILCSSLGLLPASAASASDAATLTRQASEVLDTWTESDDVKGQLEQARRMLDLSVELDPELIQTHRQFARYYIRMALADTKEAGAHFAEAEKSLQRGLAIDPQADLQALIARVYLLTDRLPEARKALEIAQTQRSQDPWLPLTLANLLKREDRHEEAIDHCRKARKRRDINALVVIAAEQCLIDSYSALARHDDEEAIHRARIKRQPEIGRWQASYASFFLCARRNPQQAIETALKGSRLPDPWISEFVLATALYRDWSEHVLAGDPAKADEAWKRAAAFPVDDPSRLVFNLCGRGPSVLRTMMALRQTGRGVAVDALTAVMLTSKIAPDSLPGIFAMQVVATGTQAGQVFLNSEDDYRSLTNLTIAFTPSAAAAFAAQHGGHPDEILDDKIITVVGYAERKRIDFRIRGEPTGKFYYQVHVKVTDPAQVAIFDPDAPPPAPPPMPDREV